MKGLLEFKSITAEVKDIDTKKRIVTGYFSNFGNVDHDSDIILPGAFAKSIKERGPQGTNEIYFLNQHNWTQPLGKPTVLQEDSKGLYFESTVTEASYGKDALILYEEGLVAQHSIGFVTKRAEPEGNTRLIQEVKLYEGSSVTRGSNELTPFTGFKSKSATELLADNDATIKSIIKCLKRGDLTDETLQLLEIALKQQQLFAFELGQKSAPVQEQPPHSTDLNNAPQEPKDDEAILNQLKNFSILN